VQTENADGGFDRTYTTLGTYWAGLKEVSLQASYIMAIRGQNTNENITHEFIVRRESVKNYGKSVTSGYSSGFNNIADIAPLKNDYFIFLNEGSTIKGRLFRIKGIKRDEDRKEYIKIMVEEIEERGTGWPA
jgi:hypothetical protein